MLRQAIRKRQTNRIIFALAKNAVHVRSNTPVVTHHDMVYRVQGDNQWFFPGRHR
jgi:hypothetical protein